MSLFNSRESGFFSGGGGGGNGVNGIGTQFYVPKWTNSSTIGIGTMRDKNSGADNFIDVTGFGIQTLLVNFASANKYVSFGEPAQGGLRTTSSKLTILGDIKATPTNSNLRIDPIGSTIITYYGNSGLGLYMDLTNANSIYQFGDYNFAYNGCYFSIIDSTESFTTYLQNTPMGIDINGSTKILKLGFGTSTSLLINNTNTSKRIRTYLGSYIYGFEVDKDGISYLGDFNNLVNVFSNTYLKVTNDSPYIVESLVTGLEKGFHIEDNGGTTQLSQFGDYNFTNNNTYVEIDSYNKNILMSTFFLKLSDKGTGFLLDDREFPITENKSLKININGTPYTIELFQP